jgi:23S rRNA (cytosine1962-C5)-methyltransferase
MANPVSRFAYSAPRHGASPTWIDGKTLELLENSRTDAHRLFSSSDCWIERLGKDVLISYKHEPELARTLEELCLWQEEHGRSFRRIFARFLPRQNEERAAPVLVEGDAALPMETVVEENGMRFGIDFAAGYSAGLFLDQRANRAFIRRAGVQRLLNSFAYTCSFSVAAALGGATTTSIDLSKKSIDRGRENFGLNGIDPAAHRFYADDVMEVLPRLARKEESFDAIVLDPPTFSRGNKGRRFQVERDFEALLLAALEVATRDARVLLSTNCTRLSRRALENIARFALKASRRSGSFHSEPALPDLPLEFAAETLWLTLR